MQTILTKINKNAKVYSETSDIESLEETLAKLSDAYYNTNTPLVSDEVFDLLLESLKKRNPSSNLLKKIGAPVTKDKVKLPCFMASLDKIKTEEDLNSWIKKYNKSTYVLSDKLDGVSALLYKKNNKLNLYTRGDGEYGQDITSLIPHVLPTINASLLEDKMCIRGELILTKENFDKVKDSYKNARNAISGLVNAKHPTIKLANLTSFVAYNIISEDYTQEEQLKLLAKYKFNIVDHKKVKKLNIKLLSDSLLDRRENSEYEVDGIVVADSSKGYKNVNTNPDNAFAFKQLLDDQKTTTQVIEVLWEPSKHGYLKPTLNLKPVNLIGVEIKSATAFNAKFVEDNLLGPGAQVEIVRSGDVIPHITKVLKPSTNKKAQMPDIKYKWTETKIDIIAEEASEETANKIAVKTIASFFKKLDVKYISEGIVTKLVANNYNNIVKIINVILNKSEDLYNINGLGETIITKIKNNLEEAIKKCDLSILMAASNILGRGLSETRIKVILEKYPDILDEGKNKGENKGENKENKEEEDMIKNITNLPGFDTKTATLFSKNFDKFKKFFNKLSKVANIKHIKKYKVEEKKSSILEDQKIVFTGFRDSKLEKFVEDNGGKLSTSVSSNTTLLIYSDDSLESSKYKKAVELNIKKITKDEFIKKYKL